MQAGSTAAAGKRAARMTQSVELAPSKKSYADSCRAAAEVGHKCPIEWHQT